MEYLPSIDTILIILAVIVGLFILFKVFKLILSLLAIVLFLGIAYFTNPGPAAHIAAVKTKAEATSATIRERNIDVDDYRIFSLTRIEPTQKVVGIGGFTYIWIFGDLSTTE